MSQAGEGDPASERRGTPHACDVDGPGGITLSPQVTKDNSIYTRSLESSGAEGRGQGMFSGHRVSGAQAEGMGMVLRPHNDANELST